MGQIVPIIKQDLPIINKFLEEKSLDNAIKIFEKISEYTENLEEEITFKLTSQGYSRKNQAIIQYDSLNSVIKLSITYLLSTGNKAGKCISRKELTNFLEKMLKHSNTRYDEKYIKKRVKRRYNNTNDYIKTNIKQNYLWITKKVKYQVIKKNK